MKAPVRSCAVVIAASILAFLLPQTAAAVNPNCSPASDTSTVPGYTVLTFTSTGICNWTAPDGVITLDTLLVVGGGGGGAGIFTVDSSSGGGGGGGGGAYLASSVSIPSSVTIQVGAGGAGGVSTSSRPGNTGSRGSTSAFGTITAGGGGGGGCDINCATTEVKGGDGTAAGSGGGSSNYYNAYDAGSAGSASSATFNLNVFAAQVGYAGGSYNVSLSTGGAGGPGGGARGAANYNTRGIGLTSTITGNSVDYGKGGGAYGVSGWSFTSSTPGYGTGGDGQRNTSASGATGAQGVVIVKYRNLSSMTASIAAGNISYRTAKTITATPNTSGKLTFKANNKVIPKCKNLAAVSNTAKTCSFKPSNRGYVNLTVTLVPADGGMATITTQVGSYFVFARSGSR
jgi:hypothetical protein